MKYFLIIAFILISQASEAQISPQDSLHTRLPLVEDADKIPILIDLVKLNQQAQPSEALRYASRAAELLESYPDEEQQSNLYTQLGWVHYYMRDYDDAFKYANMAELLAIATPSPENIARSKHLRGRLLREEGDYAQAISALDSALVYTEATNTPLLRSSILNEAGTVYRRMGNSNPAIDNHERALELIKQTNDRMAMAITYNFLGINHDILGNYDEALRFYLLSLEIQEEMDNRRGIATSLTNIGTAYQKTGRYREALNFYERSLPIWEELNLENEQASTINNIGAVHELLDNYEEAHNYYKEAYNIWNELENTYSSTIALDNMGSINMLLGEFDEAIELKKEALNNQKMLGNKRGIATTLMDLASIYNKTMKSDSALVFAEEGLEAANETGSWSVLQLAHQTLSDIHEQQGNYEMALHHHKLFKVANDSLFNMDSQTIVAELQEQFRTRQQQQQIDLLENERELQRIWVFMLGGGFILVVIVSGLMYNRYKLNERAHRTREQLHQTEIEKARLQADTIQARTRLLELEHKRKSKELDDARNLQLSMLPAELPENKYADIAAEMVTATEVGGDYYDVNISDDGTLTFCIGDATGHGTRAGILVTAVKSLFNMISEEKNPVEIIQRSSAAIKKMNLRGLYMSFALARLKERQLELVGAGMPEALIYRADSAEVESVELKGMPLGSSLDYQYTLKTATLHKNDVLVLMSDGFPELTSPEGRMLGYSRAADLLKEAGERTPEEIIEYFQNTAFEWTQTERPDDDMTFLVLKMKK